MCAGAEAIWVPAAITALGAGAGAYNQDQMLRDQDREVARGMREQAALSEQASQRVNQQIQDVAKSTPDAEAAQAESDFIGAMKRARAARGGDSLSGPGGSRFQDDLGLARTQTANEGSMLAKQLARIDAPQFQRFREGVGMNNAITDLSLLDDRSKAVDFLTRMRAANQRANPWIDAASQGLTAFGLAKSGQASKRPGAPTPASSHEAVHTGSLFN